MTDLIPHASHAATVVPARRVVVLGLCGSGMRALAEILLERGDSVVGSDSSLETTENAQFEANRFEGIGAGSLTVCRWNDVTLHLPGAHSVIATAALPANSPVLQLATRLGIPIHSLTASLAWLFGDRHQICVAGTHGKSTTTALLAAILTTAGLAPGLFVGGETRSTLRSGRSGSGPHAVLESCEYRRAFLSLRPSTVVLTGIERDHFDCFSSITEENSAFSAFLRLRQPAGALIYNADCARSMHVIQHLRHNAALEGSAVGVSLRGGTAWVGTDLQLSAGGGIRLNCRSARGHGIVVKSPLSGRHNAANLLMAVAAADSIGVDRQAIGEAIQGFAGVRRRFEHRGEWNGMTLIDDYAHHPTAIRATLSTASGSFPGRRLLTVFEPHQFSRTESLFEEFAAALVPAAETLILPVLPARESYSAAACRRLSGQLVRRINELGGRAFLMANLDQVHGRLDHAGRSGDVILTMGAGRTNQIHDEYNRRVQRHFAA